jgi:hypothetical protein
VTDKEQRALLLKPAEESHTFLDEKNIANRQRFIDDQDIGSHMGRDCESETHCHPAGIRFNRLIDEFTDVRKC